MKQRFSSLDVKVIAHELQQSLVSLRLANIYDLSSKIILLKFAKPDTKQHLIIDTGFRAHLTDYARTTAAAPSAFVARLRKLLKTRRLTAVSQAGSDRILELQFGDGHYRLFLEFFASGNIILTDAELHIVAIARNVPEGEGREPQRVGVVYSLENTHNFSCIPPLTRERVRDALRKAAEKKTKGKPGAELRKALAVSITELPPVVIEHALRASSFDEKLAMGEIADNDERLDELVACLLDARRLVEGITASPACKGYIFAKRKPNSASPPSSSDAPPTATREDLLYEHFHPFVPQGLKDDASFQVLEFDGYNKTLDEFFSSLEGQKLESRLHGREEAAERKLEAARRDQARRIEGLKDAQAVNARKAAAIEANVERVQEAMDAVNGLVAQGMDWVDIGKLVEREKKRGNPVAAIINLPLKLSENIITLTLAEEEFDDDDEGEEEEEEEDNPYETDDEDEAEMSSTKTGKDAPPKGLTVDVSLLISPWGNAREYYDQRRTAAVKEEKTQLQATKALKSTEQKIAHDLKKGLKQEKALLQPIRQPMWFEKFIWFVSSDGYLVLGGRDSHQHEMLYHRHLRRGDVFCHADLRGASPVVIKNLKSAPDASIPPATLAQAGSLCVCTSEAWDSKAGMGAWWVDAHQVSKLAAAGDVLSTGSFTIKGNKNFLPPTQLLLGFGVMFQVSDESKLRHARNRYADSEKPLEVEVEKGGEHSNESEDENENENRENPLQMGEGDAEGEGEGEGDAEGDDEIPEEVDGKLSDLKIANEADAEGQVEKGELEGGAQEGEESKGEEETGEEGEESKREDEGGEEDEEEEKGEEKGEQKQHHSVAQSSPAKKVPGKRGQKGKAKKIAQKYKHQDEDDKAAAEVLIGATAGRQRAEAEAAAKAQRQAELEAAKARRRAQHVRKQKEVADKEELRMKNMDRGDDDDDDVDVDISAVDSLVGWPLPGDEIVQVVPVCAPWNAMARFKYKVKMQPGTVKKGKAVKEILERWNVAATKKGVLDESATDRERMWPREAELIKTLKPEGINNCVPVGKVKIMLSGGVATAGGSQKGKDKGRGGKGGGGGGKGGKK